MMDREAGKVSVIIPCYNGEKYIAAAVDSVQRQTHRDLELIVVDDGSTDHSEEIVRSFSGDARVAYVAHDRNRGIPAARNTGIRSSRGEYIAFLDQDDVWYPEKLEKQVAVLARDRGGEIGLIFSDHLYEEGGRWARDAYPHQFVPAGINGMPPREVQKRLFLRNFVPCITAVIPAAVLDEVGLFDERVRGGPDDLELFLRIAGRFRFHYLDEPLATKRVHAANYSLMPRMEEDLLYIVRKMVDLYPELKALEGRRRSIIHQYLGYFYCDAGDYRQAIAHYRTAIRERPGDPFNWLKLLGALLGRWAGPRVQDAYFDCGRLVRRKASQFLGPWLGAGDGRG